MNIPPINPTAAGASVAGSNLAAAKGGEADRQATEATNQQTQAEKGGRKETGDLAIDAGEKSSDRDANGRQILDVFESHEDESQPEQSSDDDDNDEPTDSDEPRSSPDSDSPPHLDLLG